MEKSLEIKNIKNPNNKNIHKETIQKQFKILHSKTYENKNYNSPITDNSPEKSSISFLKQSEKITFENNSYKRYNKKKDIVFKYNKIKFTNNNLENKIDKKKSPNFFIGSPVHINELNNLKNDLQNNINNFNILKKSKFDDNNLDIKTELYKNNNSSRIKYKQKEKTEIDYFKIEVLFFALGE